MKYFTWFLLLFILLGCGNHEKATGGKKDVTNPEIISLFPNEFSDISNQDELEFTFSKPMDKSTMFTGVYIYPPILNKTFRWDKNTFFINIDEELESNQHYYFSFTTAIRCERRNPLDKNYLFVYVAGNMQNAKISGEIEYELPEDIGEEITINVSAADSTFMFRTWARGKQYQLENLQAKSHIVSAFIDKNENNRYDVGKEPYHRFVTEARPISVVPIALAYSDTVKPKLNRVQVQSQKQVRATFSKPIFSIDNVKIQTDSSEIKILSHVQKENTSWLVTTPLDTLEYSLIFQGVKDYKENLSDSLAMKFDGIVETDSIPPTLIYSKPSDGDSIYEQSPKIQFEFSEIVPIDTVEAYLYANESKTKINLILQETNQKEFIYKPEIPLENYTTYKLFIRAENWFEIPFDNEGNINFIVVVQDS